MKLGTQTGSVINHVMSRETKFEPTPEVGMGATILLWTDRDAGTITRIFDAKIGGKTVQVLEVTRDKSKLVSGSQMSEDQGYTFEANPNGKKFFFAKKDERWTQYQYKVLKQDYDEKTDKVTETLSNRLSQISGGGFGLKVGTRDEYRDPTF